MSITSETRAEGLCEARRKLSPRQVLIIGALRTGPMSATEVADKLGFSDLNAVKPRLHELMKAGIVQPIGKRTSARSGVGNAVYELIEKAAPSGNDTESGGAQNNPSTKIARKGGGVNGQL